MQLSGDISKVSLPNLLQLVKTGGFTGKLSIAQGVSHATIFVSDGSPVHVELEGATGIDALLEIFLWENGTFSFNEENVENTEPSIATNIDLAALIKDGILYAKQKSILKEMNIQPSTVLKPTGKTSSVAKFIHGLDFIKLIDGKKSLQEALQDQKLSRREYVRLVADWLEEGIAEIADSEAGSTSEISLPTWVVARLLQDNKDLNKAIIDMVIWVDRVKCWMYQSDAEFYQTREEINKLIEDAEGGKQIKPEELFDDVNQASTESEHFAPPSPPASFPEPEPDRDPDPDPDPKSANQIETNQPETVKSTTENQFNQTAAATAFNTFSAPRLNQHSSQSSENYNQFRLSSSFISGAGGKLSFLQNPVNTQSSLGSNDLGLESQSRPTKSKKSKVKDENDKEDK